VVEVVYIPDVVNADGLGVEVGCMCSLSSCECVRRGVPVFVDVGLAGARFGVDFGRYIRLVQRVSAVAGDVYAVVPDVFCDVEATVRNWKRWARQVGRHAKTVLVLQRFYEPHELEKYRDIIQDAWMAALPSRRHCDVYCLERPRLCAERVERALRVLRGVEVHLMGPPASVLRALGGVLNDVKSIDTSAYRKPGWRIATRGEDKTEYLAVWLRRWNTSRKPAKV